MRYTVMGIVDNTTVPRELTVAAVLEGDHEPVDVDPGDERAQRWGAVFDADTPEEAEELAYREVSGVYEDDDDE